VRLGIGAPGRASIRALSRLVNGIEAETGVRFIRMEMGVPGLPTPKPAADGAASALENGVSAVYPPFEGIPELKAEISRFLRLFLDVTIDPDGCFPTVGAMHGCYLGMMIAGYREAFRDRILLFEPGFPVHRQQARMLGLVPAFFHIPEYRGDALGPGLEEALSEGNVGAVVYSNPNNPSWISLTEDELATIGRVCRRHDVIVIEDLAYVGMDFRKDYGRPGHPPFVPTAARYTDQCLLVVSTSKVFSMAGDRIGMAAIPDGLYHRKCQGLSRRFGTRRFGRALIQGGLYGTTAGVSHSSQVALLEMLKAVNSGGVDYLSVLREYGDRAKAMKGIFLRHGFRLTYPKDILEPVADGFYFTVSYPGMSGDTLVEALLSYGISAISLSTTGQGVRDGIRACVSQTGADRFPELARRLLRFQRDHQAPG
jgi:aspartate/methionine/tyrosine aminotransferase